MLMDSSHLSQERWVNVQLSRSRLSQVSWERWINILCCNPFPSFWESWDFYPSFPRKSCSFSQLPHLHEILGIPANSWEKIPNFCPGIPRNFPAPDVRKGSCSKGRLNGGQSSRKCLAGCQGQGPRTKKSAHLKTVTDKRWYFLAKNNIVTTFFKKVKGLLSRGLLTGCSNVQKTRIFGKK